LALLFAGGALWLFLAAFPVAADGGPHSLANNSGASGLNGDCAACHRAHTAQAADLLKSTMPGLCLTCHDGSGATTDVVDGIQYVPTGSNTFQQGTVLGALRGGGFSYALINSSNPARLSYASTSNGVTSVRNVGYVGVLATDEGEKTTSTHGGTGTVWGNGAVNSGAGVTVDLECASCHNPHGNGQYRILQTTPGSDWTATVPAFADTNTAGVQVQDTTTTGTHNYTVKPATDGANANGSAANVVTADSGDYWRYHWDPTGTKLWSATTSAPPIDPMNAGWNGTSPTNAAASGGVALANSTGLMTAWCVQCHTRYSGLTVNGVASSLGDNSGGDELFMYKHGTTRIGCEQCHVAHGSNALMTASGTAAVTDPSGALPPSTTGAGTGSTTSADSRLLKVDNRGTCQLCHDPTGTVTAGTYVGPTPMPGN
jgi:predicted CXXCH cytochrome family protein